MNNNKFDIILEDVKQFVQYLKLKKKKYPGLYESAFLIEQELDQGRHLGDLQTFPEDRLMKIIQLASEIKKTKVHNSLLIITQKVINLKLLNPKKNIDILKYLIKIRDINIIKNDCQIKVQQTFLILINPDFITIENLLFIESAYNMLFLMKQSKNQIIQSTSETNIIQLLIHAQRKMQLEAEDKISLDESNFVKILKDFLLMADNQKPMWFPNIPIERELGLDVILAALNDLNKDIKKYHNVEKFFRIYFFRFTNKILENYNQYSYSFYLKCLRGQVKTLIYIQDEVEQLQVYLKILQEKELTVQKYIVFEGINFLFGQYDFLMNMFKSIPFTKEQPNIYMQLLNIIYIISKDLGSQNQKKSMSPSKIQNNSQTSEYEQDPKFMNLIDSTTNITEFPNITDKIMLKLVAEFLNKLTVSFLIIFQKDLGLSLEQIVKAEQYSEFQNFFLKVFNFSWKIIYSIQKNLLNKDCDEADQKNILNSIQIMTNISGCFSNIQACDSFLKIICTQNLGENLDISKDLQTMKVVLNMAHSLGHFISQNGWYYLMKFMKESEQFYQKNRIARDTQDTQDNLDLIFDSSSNYSDKHLKNILDSLNQITIEQMENQKHKQFQQGKDNNLIMFSIQKIQNTINYNLFRINVFWEQTISNYFCVAHNKIAGYRIQAIQSLSNFIQKAFIFIETNYIELQVNPDKPSNLQYLNNEKWSQFNYQFTLFQPWVNIINVHEYESKEIIINQILKVLQNSGHMINKNGWTQILNILEQISLDSEKSYHNIGIKNLEILVGQHLNNIHHSNITYLLNIIENFKKNSTDNNINYLSCDMFWNIGDYLSKTQINMQSDFTFQEFEILIKTILSKLIILCIDDHAEARQSAIHIFSSLILHNYQKNNFEFWLEIMKELIQNLAEKITKKLNSDLNQEEQKLWQETAKNMIINISKIIKKLFQLELTQTNSIEMLTFFYELIFQLISSKFPDVIIECVKQLKEIYLQKIRDSLYISHIIKKIFIFLDDYYSVLPKHIKIVKIMLQRISQEIILIFHEFLDVQILPEDEQIVESLLKFQIQFFHKITVFPKIADTTFNLQLNKIFYNEKIYFDFIEKFQSVLPERPKFYKQIFLDMIQQFLVYSKKDKFYDSIFRKLIKIMGNEILNDKESQEYVKKFIIFFMECISTKFSIDYAKFYNNEIQNIQPIWIETTGILINVSQYLIQKNIITSFIYDQFVQLLSKPRIPMNEMEKYLNIVQIKEYYQHDENLLNFSFQNFMKNQQNDDIKLKFAKIFHDLSLIFDQIENDSYRLEEIQLNFSQLCQTYVFELCYYQENNIHKILPFILSFSRLKIQNFINEQINNNNKRFKVTYICFLIEKLLQLDLPIDTFRQIEEKSIYQELPISIKKDDGYLLNLKKSHIIYLFPLFIKLLNISQKEQELKNIMPRVFEEITIQMQLDQFYQK